MPSMFISYNQNSGSRVADEIEGKASGLATVYRDINSVQYGERLSEFMKSISDKDLVIMIISDNYIKSEACMKEVMEAMKNQNWISNTLFFVMDDAKGIYKTENWMNYIKYWDDYYDRIEKSLSKTTKSVGLSIIYEKLEIIDDIRKNICRFFECVNDCRNAEINEASKVVIRKLSEIKNNNIKFNFDIVNNGWHIYLKDICTYATLSLSKAS